MTNIIELKNPKFDARDIEIKSEMQIGTGRHSGKATEGFVLQMRYKDKWFSCGMSLNAIKNSNELRDVLNGMLDSLIYNHFGLVDNSPPQVDK